MNKLIVIIVYITLNELDYAYNIFRYYDCELIARIVN